MAYTATTDLLANLVASPVVKPAQTDQGGKTRTVKGLILAASFVGGTVGQIYGLLRVPVRARLGRVGLVNATATTGFVSMGLYRTNGVAVDAVCLSSGIPLTAHTSAQTDVVAAPSALQHSQLISAAFKTAIGTASATNDIELDIGIAIITVAGSAVDLYAEAEYTIDE